MKVKERVKTNKFYKLSSSGISLIVLVITIIVIIILATAIIVSVLDNNPLSEANKSRFQSDRDNMQSIFTNTVAKVMAVKQASIRINPGTLNEVTSGVKNTTGIANYEIENGETSSKAGGTITFDNQANTETEYYTGKQLPIYKAGETKWYVDSEGILLLEVGEQVYGEGKKEVEGSEGEKIEVSKDEFNALKLRVTKLEEENVKLKSELETSVEQLKETVNVLQTTKLKIDGARSGQINIGSVGINTSKQVSVTFKEPMLDTNYSVVVTNINNVRHAIYTELNIMSKSKEGFVLKVNNMQQNEATGDLVANYIAIPYTE